MIEVKERLYVTPKEFFNVLENSLVEEIKMSSGKKVKAKDLKKGYVFYKKMSNKIGSQGNIKVKFDEYIRNQVYEASFFGAQGITKIGYYIEPLDDESIGVKYIEKFEGKSTLKNWNQKMMEFIWYRRKASKKAKKMLRQIERYIQEERNVEQEVMAEMRGNNDE